MQDKNITKSTFFQFFRPIFSENLQKELNAYGVDKYVKKLTTLRLIQVIICAQLNQDRSLREMSNHFNDDRFSQEIGIDSFSAAQLSRRLRDLPTYIVQSLFSEIMSIAVKLLGVNKVNRELGALRIIDSSTISLCLTQYPWAVFRKTKSGVKLHLSLSFINGMTIPEEAIITPAKQNDRKQLDNLVHETDDALHVFDRGYVDYEKFDNYCQADIRFVSRLKDNAIVEVIENRLNYDRPAQSDMIVKLGTNAKKMKHELRLIEVTDTQGNPIRIITNDFQLSPEELGDIYRHRWQIELFFKWIKQHCCVKHFYGLSQQAVENQIFLALITYCLLQLLKLKTAEQNSLLQILTLLTTCLYDPYELFLKKLSRRRRNSKGRRKFDYKKIYEMTERQVRQCETELLYEIAYDPVIL